MKRISLKNINTSQKTYTVFLGNGTTHSFKSERSAQDFINKTNKFLTEHLHEIHAIYSSVSILLNHNWFYFQNDKNTRKAHLYQFERDCNNNIDSIRATLNRIVDHSHFTNGNYTTFIDLLRASNYLQDTIKILNVINKNRSNTNALYEYKSLFNRLIQLDNSLKNYSQFQSVKSFDVPKSIGHSTPFIPQLKIA
jgi:hypothetical protein